VVTPTGFEPVTYPLGVKIFPRNSFTNNILVD
jgi:hypothetical protein